MKFRPTGMGWNSKEVKVNPAVPVPGQRIERKINNGITGDARRASAALGKRYFDMKVTYAVRQIRQLLGSIGSSDRD